MPCAFKATEKASRSLTFGSRMVYCAHTEVQPLARRGTDTLLQSPRAYRSATTLRAAISSSKIFSFSIRIAACRVSSRPVSPSRTLSYLSVPWPCMRMLPSVSASWASSVKIPPAIAKAAERFCGEKAGRGDEAEGAEPAAPVARAERLGCVVEHEHALGLRDTADGVM